MNNSESLSAEFNHAAIRVSTAARVINKLFPDVKREVKAGDVVIWSEVDEEGKVHAYCNVQHKRSPIKDDANGYRLTPEDYARLSSPKTIEGIKLFPYHGLLKAAGLHHEHRK